MSPPDSELQPAVSHHFQQVIQQVSAGLYLILIWKWKDYNPSLVNELSFFLSFFQDDQVSKVP